MGLYRDLEKFRTLSLYIGLGIWKIPIPPPMYYGLWDLEKFPASP